MRVLSEEDPFITRKGAGVTGAKKDMTDKHLVLTNKIKRKENENKEIKPFDNTSFQSLIESLSNSVCVITDHFGPAWLSIRKIHIEPCRGTIEWVVWKKSEFMQIT